MKKSDIEVAYVDHCGSDLSVVNAARVSFKKVHDEIKDGDEKLIRFLARNKHTSPFNHAFLSFHIKAPIFVARQLVKHKFMPWNEVSRRYVDEEPEFYIPDMWRLRANDVKQGSSDKLIYYFTDDYVKSCVSKYQEALEEGIAPEMCRMLLPQNMMTEWYWSGTLGAYADMLRLRLGPHTQYESRIVANKLYNEIEMLFPISIDALLENR